jgi:hypothetical protein
VYLALNFIVRPDVLITYISGVRLLTTVIVLVNVLATSVGCLVAAQWYKTSRHGSKFRYQFETVVALLHYLDSFTFRLMFIPTVFHTNIGVSCYFAHDWCGDISLPDVVLSWIGF